MALSGATTSGQGEPGGDDIERVLCIPQRSSITEKSTSDCLVSCPGNSLVGSYPSVGKQLVYFTASANWAILFISVVLTNNSIILIVHCIESILKPPQPLSEGEMIMFFSWYSAAVFLKTAVF